MSHTELAAHGGPDPLRGGAPSAERWDMHRLPVVSRDAYEVSGEIGRGGLGRILNARDPRLGRPVALKELLDAHGSGTERFVREAVLTARLQHPAIVPVYEAGCWPSGEPFYAMKLVSGRSLDTLIDEARSLDKRLTLLPHVLAAAEAVAYAHRLRIIHRDLKPANVLVGELGETVVIDWGLAKDLAEEDTAGAMSGKAETSADELQQADPLTAVGAVLGTPAYMAPEQARGLPAGERADVYALGAMLYHLLAGDLPYRGHSAQEVVEQVATTAPPALEQRQAGIPLELLAITDKAMSRDLERRYPTAKELADDLRRFQTGQIVAAHRYSWPELLRRFARRNRALLVLAAAALAVIAAGTVASVSRIRSERDTAQRERDHAQQRADELTLAQARESLGRDPNASIAWLKGLSPAFRRWGAVRTIAADATSRGIAKVIREHSAPAGAIVFSPDGTLLATISDDRTVVLRDLRTGKTRPFSAHADEAWCGAFSPDGKLLATGGKDKVVRLRDISTGQERVLEGHAAGVTKISFSPDGKLLATRGELEKVRLWNVATGESRVLSQANNNGRATFSPDGKTVAFADEGGLARFSVTTADRRVFPGLEGGLTELEFSPDGARIATGGRDGAVRLWNAETGASEVLYSHEDGKATGVMFSALGERVISTGSDGAVKIWDLGARTLRTLAGHVGPIRRMAAPPDGTVIATAGADGTLRLWNVETGQSHVLSGFTGGCVSTALSREGGAVAGGGADGTVRLWRLPAQAFVATHGAVARAPVSPEPEALRHVGGPGEHGPVSWAVFSPDGRRAATLGADGSLRLTTLPPRTGGSAGNMLGSTAGPAAHTVFLQNATPKPPAAARNFDNTVTKPFAVRPGMSIEPGLKFSADGEQIGIVDDDGTVRVYRSGGGEPHILRGMQPQVLSIAFAPDGKLLAAGGKDGTVWLWDIGSGEGRIVFRHRADVMSILFSPDGKALASGGLDGLVRLSDVAQGGGEKDLRGHTGAILSLAFSRDGATLISGGHDHTLRLWNLKNDQCIVRNAAATGVRRLVLFPDGKSVAALGEEGSVQLWDMGTGDSLGVLQGNTAQVAEIAVSPDGQRLVIASVARTVHLKDLATGESRVLGVYPGTGSAMAFGPDGLSVAVIGTDGNIQSWPDDLPTDPAALRSWIEQATPETIDLVY